MRRRDFLAGAGLTLGATPPAFAVSRREPAAPFHADDWAAVRNQFPLNWDHIHMATFLMASHPHSVAEAIEGHRRALDENPAGYIGDNFRFMDRRIRNAAAEYTGGDPDGIALTDSTTMGLGLIYGTVHLEPHHEAVCTTHCHYSTQMALQHRAERTGATVRQVPLYADPARVSVDEIVSNTVRAIREQTRVLAVTWVQSSTGVKLPLTDMSRAIKELNASRDPADRVLFCVDGVHGFGVEDVRVEEIGCDFFIAGTHKWIFGPRGTGIIWASPDVWKTAAPIVPSFSRNYRVWMGYLSRDDVAAGALHTPGGFHSFEHRWALPEAFRFHLRIGMGRVQHRIHELNTMTKTEMARMPHVKLHTPLSAELSSGIICFEVNGYRPKEVVEAFKKHNIIASRSPYRVSYARLAPSLLNNEDEIERTMQVLQNMT
jgi:selenocysteine lyase/cysteine desulfurase